MSFVRNAAGVLLTSVVRIPLGIGTSVLLARALSVEDRGLYAVAASIATVGALVLQLGWPAAAIYRVRSAGSPPPRVVGAGLAVLASMSLLVLAGGYFLEPVVLPELLPGAPPLVLFLALAIIPARLLGRFFGGVARALDRFAAFNVFNFLLNFGTLVGLSVALLLVGGGLREAVIALAIVEIGLAAGFGLQMLARTGLPRGVDRSEVGSSLRFGIKSYAQMLAGRLHMRIDIFMLIYLLDDPVQVGYYAIAASVMRYLQLVPMAVSTALFPSLAGMTEAKAARLAAVVSRHSVAWAALMTAPLFVAAPLIVPFVYGESYHASVPAVLVLLPGMFFFASHRPLGGFFTAINRQQVNIISQSVSTLLNVALNLWLIPRFGILGAAAASLISYSLQALVVTTVFARATRIPLRSMLVLKGGDAHPYRERLRVLRQRLPIAQ